MNRIQLRTPVPKTTNIGLGFSTWSPQQRVPHSLFAPLHYEPNYAYPLLVWLHGRGGDEHQLRRVIPLISTRNYVAVSPRGTVTAPHGARGFDWSDTATAIVEATQRVFESIETAHKRYHISPQRVFLVGFESGGTMAFRIGLRHPDAFAGVMSVGGPFPATGNPLSCLRQARQLPLFVAQGRDSLAYPVERTCEELRLLHAAGFSITLRQYPCGDELDMQMLHDIDVWVMEQVTGVPSQSDEVSSCFFDLD